MSHLKFEIRSNQIWHIINKKINMGQFGGKCINLKMVIFATCRWLASWPNFLNGVVDENMCRVEFSQLTGDVRSNDNLNQLDGMIYHGLKIMLTWFYDRRRRSFFYMSRCVWTVRYGTCRNWDCQKLQSRRRKNMMNIGFGVKFPHQNWLCIYWHRNE